MTHDEIMAFATKEGFAANRTTQSVGQDLTAPGIDLTLITGAVDDPFALAKSWFDEPQRKHKQAEGCIAYGFDDEHVILVVVDQDEVQWLHAMIYDDEATYESGWATQSVTQQS